MASSDKELEQQLMDAGNKLLEPPDSVDELLPLLDVSFTLFIPYLKNLMSRILLLILVFILYIYYLKIFMMFLVIAKLM